METDKAYDANILNPQKKIEGIKAKKKMQEKIIDIHVQAHLIDEKQSFCGMSEKKEKDPIQVVRKFIHTNPHVNPSDYTNPLFEKNSLKSWSISNSMCTW